MATINSALKITKDTVGNSVYKKILTETEERVSQGEKISSVLVKYPEYAPPNNSSFNDVFGFFISGPGIAGLQNIAQVPGYLKGV